MPSGSGVYRFGPFEFDAPRGRLFCGPTLVPLSDPQAAILVQLVSHAGDVVSKHTLVTSAWRDSAVTDNSLDQAVSRLRKTLGSGQDGRCYIETVPNLGYRFAAVIERAQPHDPDASLKAQLAPFRALVQGQADLDTLDRDAILRARRAFQDVLHAAPDDAPAHVGLANACGLAFESTRVDIVPDVAGLTLAIGR